MKIKVTKEDIMRGQRSIPSACPVARAIHRITNKNCLVGSSVSFSIPMKAKSRKVKLPESVISRIANYDLNGDMQPFEFDLPITKKWLSENQSILSGDYEK